ncbi:DUF3105 domain-containing protein [Phycicoccus sp. BSK3Z-2]|uniref:DUF3105 domain-containing protein n=1 Tax=Phycicoccus avicenniae TaxID=2828860 RepID=A0A941D649_9MICO|nr:DUF3105 domain-containing protein [Phycicoccus avicenniae]MBR7742336.1 DUF3105 domain-containing protein [Phycicoccus avicenniae]
MRAGPVAAASLALAGLTGCGSGDDTPDIDGLVTWDLEPSHVTTPVDYPMTPGAGGPHHPTWLDCGVYDEPVPDENAVHSLEHGAVWVAYRPDTAADQVDALVASLPDTYVVVSPYPGLEAPVVATAWGAQVALDGVDDPRLKEFVVAYRQGPDTLEPGAPCHAGTDGTTATPQPEG